MEDARSDSFEATRVESRLKEFLEAQRATAKEPTGEERRDAMTKNLQVDIFKPGVSLAEKVQVVADFAELAVRMKEGSQVEHQQGMLIDELSRLSEEDQQKLSDALERQKDADVSDAHVLYCEQMKNYGDSAYQEDSVPRNRAEKRARKRPIKGGSPGGLRQMPVGSLESLLHFRGR